MKRNHFDVYFSKHYALKVHQAQEDEIIEGLLVSHNKERRHVPIKKGIPRFVEELSYADNFGLQWNAFRSTQLDSYMKLPLTAQRLWNNSKWRPKELKDKKVLEVGSGAGRFTEVFLSAGAQVVSFDLSNAVEANYANNSHKGDLFLFQGNLFDLPFDDGSFDFVFCHGVLQHTPNPERAFYAIQKKLKPGGEISIDVYLKDGKIRPWKSKYLWRPLTTRMQPERLLSFLKWFIPKWLPFDTVIKHIPVLRHYLGAIIPCWNYFYTDLSKKEKVEWAIMDTFDALAAHYDIPVTVSEVERWFATSVFAEFEVFKGGNGVVGNGRRME